MIPVKEAVQVAFEYANAIFQEKPALEEIEPSNDDKSWLITLSFDDLSNKMSLMGDSRAQRRYKVFKIDGESKEVSTVKIRQL
ncbi:MAG: hypothetical protein ACHQIM_00025 [Sphingobacteriales bacterium]